VTYHAIVVGSGPAGANAAAALIERGKSVLMLDVGDVDARYEQCVPGRPFSDIRRTDEGQHRYMLGDSFEGVSLPGVRVGAQLTPPRMYVTATAARYLRVASRTFAAAESLALGGLGAAWGAGVFPFDESELADWPLGVDVLRPHYEAVAQRIGMSGAVDDLAAFMQLPASVQPPLEIDANGESLLRAYASRREELNRAGLFMGRPPLAVCTAAFRGRGPHQYRDMEFWADSDRSVYRPRWTVEELKKASAFRYVARQLVLRFEERDGSVAVVTRNVDTGQSGEFHARVLLLGAGTLGTTRIVLRSLRRYGDRVPLLCNPYTYVPVINLRMLGRPARDRRHSLAQLTAIYQPRAGARSRGSVQVQVYSWRSLLTFRLLAESPLPYREGVRMMRLLVPMLGILGINHDDELSEGKHCVLRRGQDEADDTLEIEYTLTREQAERIERDQARIIGLFRGLGLWPIKRVHPGHGASIHYAGAFPMRADATGLTCDRDGRLAASRAVYLVDGSTFPYLPAKGLTFTIMANADRIASLVAAKLA
jgi:choline dehydrogenase-like flavoprotein